MKRIIILSMVVTTLIIAFQNCSGGGFQSSQSFDLTSESHPQPPTPTPPSNDPPPTTAPDSPPPINGSIKELIQSMSSNSWKSLPSTQMKDICPLPYNSYACESVVSAWSGGAYDERRDRLIVIGGGHGDSWYNNVFAFNLPTLKWERLTEMPEGSGSKPPEWWKDIRLEPCGFYPKGPPQIPAELMVGAYVDPTKCFIEPLLSQLDLQQPRSTHSYGRVYVDHLRDKYCFIPLGTYPSAQTGTPVVPCLDPVSRKWERIADRPNGVAGRGQTALDAQGSVWALTAEGGPIGKYDPMTNNWSTYGWLNYNAGGGTDIDRKRGHLYVLYPESQTQYILRQFNLNSTESLKTKPYYTEVSTSGDQPNNLGTRPGFVYADALDQFFSWGGGQDIYSYNPINATWTKHQGSGDNPGPQTQWGTYGRFRYSPNLGVFVLVNSTKQNVFIYKP